MRDTDAPHGKTVRIARTDPAAWRPTETGDWQGRALAAEHRLTQLDLANDGFVTGAEHALVREAARTFAAALHRIVELPEAGGHLVRIANEALDLRFDDDEYDEDLTERARQVASAAVRGVDFLPVLEGLSGDEVRAVRERASRADVLVWPVPYVDG